MEVRQAANETVLSIEYVTSTVHLPPLDAIMITRMALHHIYMYWLGDPDHRSFMFNDCILGGRYTQYICSIHPCKSTVGNESKKDIISIISIFEPWRLRWTAGPPRLAENYQQNTLFLATFVWPLLNCMCFSAVKTCNLINKHGSVTHSISQHPPKKCVVSSKVQVAASKWLGDRKFR